MNTITETDQRQAVSNRGGMEFFLSGDLRIYRELLLEQVSIIRKSLHEHLDLNSNQHIDPIEIWNNQGQTVFTTKSIRALERLPSLSDNMDNGTLWIFINNMKEPIAYIYRT